MDGLEGLVPIALTAGIVTHTLKSFETPAHQKKHLFSEKHTLAPYKR